MIFLYNRLLFLCVFWNSSSVSFVVDRPSRPTEHPRLGKIKSTDYLMLNLVKLKHLNGMILDRSWSIRGGAADICMSLIPI